MEQSYPSQLRLWEGPATAAEQELFPCGEESAAQPAAFAHAGPHNPVDFAHRLFAYESLNPPAPVTRFEEQVEPYSLQWFLNIEKQRHSRQGRWIPRLLEFAKHSGETLLGVGHGLGTDWLQYARFGAKVIVCSASTSQLGLIRRNFELRGLEGRFVHARPNCLPLDTASIDVVCISSLVQGVDNTKATIEEVYRVLKPGGKVLAVTRARYDVDFWFRTVFFWYGWLGATRREAADVNSRRYSGRGLRRLFHRFIEHRIHKRQLRRSEVPHVWRVLPLPVLARLMGRVLVMKAFKPVSIAISSPALAA
jgi:ubiquinone/menaquinone biosynthesis C-methylase UbiE